MKVVIQVRSMINLSCHFNNTGSSFNRHAFTRYSNSSQCGSISQRSSVICSHEKIEIELVVGSEVNSSQINSSSCTEIIHGNNMADKDGTQDEKLDAINFNSSKKPRTESKMTEQLLSMDDSLLENVDLSCQKIVPDEKDDYINKKSCIAKETEGVGLKKKYEYSPDMFISIDKENDDQNDLEDQAWDMSISLHEETNQSFSNENKNCNSENNVISPGLTNIILSTWDSPTSVKKSGTFEGLLKRTLTCNAHKTIVRQSSPRTRLSGDTLSGIKRSCPDAELYFGLPSNVKRLIKRFKGISTLYGK